jgi:hypothetical protein
LKKCFACRFEFDQGNAPYDIFMTDKEMDKKKTFYSSMIHHAAEYLIGR